ncbi:uncharacterized protein RSE6_06087 [Rhynchosporium secalis]|uniref:DUF7908 domain-containing protein n=1 Tax=Rhynchosporium secalis TaxID=38038 RepID=A0A1E1M9M4_RHYSE|nr:uncharacterized protein RSE6_06087 [Rhynchosporium secalis]
MLIRRTISFLSLLSSVAGADLDISSGDQDCIEYNGGQDEHITVVNVVKTRVEAFPVIINTFIQQNTSVNFQGGVTLTINNAPTQILTIATGSTTATNTIATTILPGNVQVFQTTNIINFPVVIKTFLQQNTIIQGGGGVNIVINNAPTYIFTTATGTSTEIVTVTSTVTTSNSAPTSFILSPSAVAGLGPRQLSRPQYISPSGTIIPGCSDAQIFSISNGQLSSGNNLVSVNEGVASAPFVAAQAIEKISTTFSVSDTLEWSNSAFSGNKARFCSQDSRVNALFTLNATIVDCVPQRLFVIPATDCVNGVVLPPSSVSSALPSTTTGSFSNSTSSTVSPAETTSLSQTEGSLTPTSLAGGMNSSTASVSG